MKTIFSDQMATLLDKLLENLATNNEKFHRGVAGKSYNTKSDGYKWNVKESNKEAFVLMKKLPVTVRLTVDKKKPVLLVNMSTKDKYGSGTDLTYYIQSKWWSKDQNLNKFLSIFNHLVERDKQEALRKMRADVDNDIVEAFPDVIDDILLKD